MTAAFGTWTTPSRSGRRAVRWLVHTELRLSIRALRSHAFVKVASMMSVMSSVEKRSSMAGRRAGVAKASGGFMRLVFVAVHSFQPENARERPTMKGKKQAEPITFRGEESDCCPHSLGTAIRVQSASRRSTLSVFISIFPVKDRYIPSATLCDMLKLVAMIRPKRVLQKMIAIQVSTQA